MINSKKNPHEKFLFETISYEENQKEIKNLDIKKASQQNDILKKKSKQKNIKIPTTVQTFCIIV